MPGVCFRRAELWEQNQWSFVFTNFGITEIWERGFMTGDGEMYQDTVAIDTIADLPQDRTIVILAPKEGRFIQGNESLVDFDHPNDAIYVFGGSHENLELGDCVPDHLVYIPTVEHELYAHTAASVTLYDRLLKSG